MSVPTHAALLLAAGASVRLGQPKALLTIDGEPLARRTARALLATRPYALLVVTGEPTLGARIAETLAGLDVRMLDCAEWASGMGASLRAGLTAAATLPVDGLLVCPCDLPRLEARRLDALLAAWRTKPARAAACRYAGIGGTPAVLPRTSWPEIDGAGDRGARDWLRSQAEVTLVDAPELVFDIDLPHDLPGAR